MLPTIPSPPCQAPYMKAPTISAPHIRPPMWSPLQYQDPNISPPFQAPHISSPISRPPQYQDPHIRPSTWSPPISSPLQHQAPHIRAPLWSPPFQAPYNIKTPYQAPYDIKPLMLNVKFDLPYQAPTYHLYDFHLNWFKHIWELDSFIFSSWEWIFWSKHQRLVDVIKCGYRGNDTSADPNMVAFVYSPR